NLLINYLFNLKSIIYFSELKQIYKLLLFKLNNYVLKISINLKLDLKNVFLFLKTQKQFKLKILQKLYIKKLFIKIINNFNFNFFDLFTFKKDQINVIRILSNNLL